MSIHLMTISSEGRDPMPRSLVGFKPCRPRRWLISSNFRNTDGAAFPQSYRVRTHRLQMYKQTEAKGSKDSGPDQEEQSGKEEANQGPEIGSRDPQSSKQASLGCYPKEIIQADRQPHRFCYSPTVHKGDPRCRMDFRRRTNAHNCGRVASERIFLR
jgi:hypothetical protein